MGVSGFVFGFNFVVDRTSPRHCERSEAIQP
jgi:hypothetical protein